MNTDGHRLNSARLQRRIRVLLGFIVACSLLAIVAEPYIVRARRPQRQSFQIDIIFAQAARVKDAFDLDRLTQQSVVVEGPCIGGCYGGVLNRQLSVDANVIVSSLHGHEDKTTDIIWLYQVKPTSVERRNDIFGDDELTIKGKQTKDGRVYFAVVPNTFTAPHLEWIFVETK